jgi:hypothetical protein
MSTNQDGRRFTHRLLRRLAVGAGILTLLTLAALSWSLFIDGTHRPASRPMSAAVTTGWGEEALQARAPNWSPIPVANACGLGASSCFKCHNGSRAAAPKTDKQNGEWHAQHAHVNDDCVGCHAGNPRIIKKELAHTALVADPRTQPARCAACHKSEDIATLLKPYQRTK